MCNRIIEDCLAQARVARNKMAKTSQKPENAAALLKLERLVNFLEKEIRDVQA